MVLLGLPPLGEPPEARLLYLSTSCRLFIDSHDTLFVSIFCLSVTPMGVPVDGVVLCGWLSFPLPVWPSMTRVGWEALLGRIGLNAMQGAAPVYVLLVLLFSSMSREIFLSWQNVMVVPQFNGQQHCSTPWIRSSSGTYNSVWLVRRRSGCPAEFCICPWLVVEFIGGLLLVTICLTRVVLIPFGPSWVTMTLTWLPWEAGSVNVGWDWDIAEWDDSIGYGAFMQWCSQPVSQIGV